MSGHLRLGIAGTVTKGMFRVLGVQGKGTLIGGRQSVIGAVSQRRVFKPGLGVGKGSGKEKREKGNGKGFLRQRNKGQAKAWRCDCPG